MVLKVVKKMWTCSGCNEEIEEPFDACWNCGTDKDGNQVIKIESDEPAKSAAKESVVISRECPKCGCKEFRTTRPTSFVSFTKDRICTSCNSQYTPPTPKWGGITLIAVGCIFALGSAVALLSRLAAGTLLGLPGTIIELFLGFVGLAAIRQGIKVMFETELSSREREVQR